MVEGSSFAKSLKSPIQRIVASGILLFCGRIILPPRYTDFGPRENPILEKVRRIGLAMFAYANDHAGKYPKGKSSTEVFQILIDEKYVTDSDVFFEKTLEIPSKTKPTSNVLKPENVCWDITVPLDTTSSDFLPVVYSTGYKINYVRGGNALPLQSGSGVYHDGIAVAYMSNSACWKNSQPDGVVTNFISPDFVPDGKKYQQLTPDGPLAP